MNNVGIISGVRKGGERIWENFEMEMESFESFVDYVRNMLEWRTSIAFLFLGYKFSVLFMGSFNLTNFNSNNRKRSEERWEEKIVYFSLYVFSLYDLFHPQSPGKGCGQIRTGLFETNLDKTGTVSGYIYMRSD